MERRLPQLAIDLPHPEGRKLDPSGLFSPPVAEVWLEIGFGAGEHIAWQAAHHPEIGFVGCEPYVNGIASLLSQIDEQSLSNVRIFADDARLLVAHLHERSIGRLFILFPDPWPKTRHHKRRIIGQQTLAQYARVLKDGAELRIATDHSEHARWIVQHMAEATEFRWSARRPQDWRERPPDWPETRYEAKAASEGQRSVYLRYTRVARTTGAAKKPESA